MPHYKRPIDIKEIHTLHDEKTYDVSFLYLDSHDVTQCSLYLVTLVINFMTK